MKKLCIFPYLALPQWCINLCGVTGVALFLAGVICFFAYNWEDMGKIIKLGLPLLGMLGTAFVCYCKGTDSDIGKACSVSCGVFLGVFWAVYGQIYQTGAFVYEFFLGWAVCLLPLACLAGNRWLWLLWAGLLNAYFLSSQNGYHPNMLFWQIFLLNTTCFIFAERVYYQKKQGSSFSFFFLIPALLACMIRGFDGKYFWLSFCIILLFAVYAYAKKRGAGQLGLCALAIDCLLIDLIFSHLFKLFIWSSISISLFIFVVSAWAVYMLSGRGACHD